MQSTQTTEQSTEFSNKIILADKPLEYTSAGVVRIFKKTFKIKKIGHAGTLDPRATGLLILCTDKMTKSINEFMDYEKEYEGIIRIGATTPSFDTETAEENVVDAHNVSDEGIENARQEFLGETFQIPPMFSAVKHKGKPLYKMARKGREIERSPRKIIVSQFEVTRLNETELKFKIRCSKGTYIRTIANDFGAKLGVGGYLKELRRTAIGKFRVEGLEREVSGVKFLII